MQQHANKLQRAKEEAALKAMRRLLPDMSPAVWILALEECNWDVEPAVIMLNTFKVARSDEIHRLEKARLAFLLGQALHTSRLHCHEESREGFQNLPHRENKGQRC